MSTQRHWYCPESVTEHNLTLVEIMGERDFKRFKAFYNLLVTAAILGMALFAIREGADPTAVGTFAIAGILTVNGVSLAEWLAVKQELSNRNTSEQEDG
jgi:hypothetical protein